MEPKPRFSLPKPNLSREAVSRAAKVAAAGVVAAVALAGTGRVESQTDQIFERWVPVLETISDINSILPTQLDQDPELEILTLEGPWPPSCAVRVYDRQNDNSYKVVSDINPGSGPFGCPTIALADFTGRGELDLASVSYGGYLEDKIEIREKTRGVIEFNEPDQSDILTSAGSCPEFIDMQYVTLADGTKMGVYVTGDRCGKEGNQYRYAIGTFRKDGGGWIQNSYPMPFPSEKIRIADSTGDGNEDINVLRSNTSRGDGAFKLMVLPGDGRGGFGQPMIETIEGKDLLEGTIAVGKLGVDDQNKIVISALVWDGIWSDSIEYNMYLVDASQGTLTLVRKQALTGLTEYVRNQARLHDIVDVNGDGANDLAGDNHTDTFVYCLVDNEGKVSPCRSYDILPRSQPGQSFRIYNKVSAWADYNGDGQDYYLHGIEKKIYVGIRAEPRPSLTPSPTPTNVQMTPTSTEILDLTPSVTSTNEPSITPTVITPSPTPTPVSTREISEYDAYLPNVLDRSYIR